MAELAVTVPKTVNPNVAELFTETPAPLILKDLAPAVKPCVEIFT